MSELVIPPDVVCFDVEGIPVTLGTVSDAIPYCAAWDVSPPRPFNASSAARNGAEISPEAFKCLVTEVKGTPAGNHKGQVSIAGDDNLDVSPLISHGQPIDTAATSPDPSTKPLLVQPHQQLKPGELRDLAARTAQSFVESLNRNARMSQEPPTKAKH